MNTPTIYKDRDDAFGRAMLTLRTQLGLTQSSLAKIVGVSSRTITGWEAGASYPSIEHFKRLIELAVQQHVFHSGREREEIGSLWKQAHQRVLLDEVWLNTVLNVSTFSPPLEGKRNISTVPSSVSSTKSHPYEQNSLLMTKFFIPSSLQTLVARPRLTTKMLDISFKCSLTFVSAPAGFGKTTLLASWLRSLREDEQFIAWLSLDKDDNDPLYFWHSLLTALKHQLPGSYINLLASLQTHQHIFLAYLVPALLEQLSGIQKPLLVVLDDYSYITETTIHTMFASLVEHLPPHVHLILSSRSDAPFSLSRLRVQGKLLEVRTEQLRCTLEETRLFLESVMHVSLSTEQIQQVYERTEGWLVGIQLLGLSLQDRKMPENLSDLLSGSQHYILDFLTDEVLQKQDVSVQAFLLQTSILEQLSAPLCEAVLQQRGSQQMLDYLERANLFVVSLDIQHRWYRYHALFAEALRYRLALMGDETVVALHGRASMWYEQQGQINDAIMHALQAHDWHRAADLIERVARTQGQARTRGDEMHICRWIEQLPKEVSYARPFLCLTYALFLFTGQSSLLTEDWLSAAEVGIRRQLSHLRAEPGEAESIQYYELNDMLGMSLAIQGLSAAYRGKIALANKLTDQATKYLSEKNVHMHAEVAANRGLIHLALGESRTAALDFLEAARFAQTVEALSMVVSQLGGVGKILMYQGHLYEAWDFLEQSIAFCQTESSFVLPYVSDSYGFQADILRERNELDAAEELINRAIQVAEPTKLLTTLIAIYPVQAHIAWAKGKYDVAVSCFEQAEQVAAQLKSPFIYAFQVLPKLVGFLIAQGKIAQAIRVVERLLQQEQQPTPLALERIEVAKVRILLAQQEAEKPLRILPALLHEAVRQERFGYAIEMHLLQSLAFQMVYQGQEALASLREALRLAQPEGYIRIFVDEGPQMKTLLRALRQQSDQQEMASYLDTLLAAFASSF